MKKLKTDQSTKRPIQITALCLAVTMALAATGSLNAQENGALLQEVQAMLRKPLPTPPDGVTLPPGKSDEALARELRAMLFGNEAAGQVKTLAAAPAGASTTQSNPPAIAGSQAAAGNPLAGQIRVELPPAPPEKYAPTAAQARRPAALPDPAVIPLPPHPPESQAPSVQPRPPAAPPVRTGPAPRPVQLPDPTIIPLPPHPPEDQAPWRQGV